MFTVLGATGKVGGTTITALRREGVPVRAVVRIHLGLNALRRSGVKLLSRTCGMPQLWCALSKGLPQFRSFALSPRKQTMLPEKCDARLKQWDRLWKRFVYPWSSPSLITEQNCRQAQA